MLNQFVIVGRYASLKEDPQFEDLGVLSLNCVDSYKQPNGEYASYIIDVSLTKGNIMDNVSSHLKPGDVVGVKGKVMSRSYDRDGKMFRRNIILAEKVSFLSSATNTTGPQVADEEDVEIGG